MASINIDKIPNQASSIINTSTSKLVNNTEISKQDTAKNAVIEALKKVDSNWEGDELRILFDSILKGLKL